jgi:hypothetical protein
MIARKFLLAAALALMPGLALAQAAYCPDYSQHATTHPAAETAYTLSPNDQCKLLVFQNTGAETVTLPVPNALFPMGWTVHVFAAAAGTVTLTAATGTTINGGATLADTTGIGTDLYVARGNAWWGKP